MSITRQQRVRYTVLVAVGVLLTALALWQIFTPRQATYSQEPVPEFVESLDGEVECAITFLSIPDNIPLGQTAVISWRHQSADPTTIQIDPPDPAIATVLSNTETSAMVRANAQGVDELTVSMLCENNRQAGQRIGGTAVVIVDNAAVDGTDGTLRPPSPAQSDDGATGAAEEQAADLEVLYPAVIPSTVDAGGSVRVGVEVHNEGDQPAPATKIKFYRSSNSTISQYDTLLATYNVAILLQEEDRAYVHYFTAPNAEGRYYYGACVDTFAGEFSSANNCSAGVLLTVEDDEPTPTPTFTPTPTPVGGNVEPPEKPVMAAYWSGTISGGRYAKGEWERVADGEDYYNVAAYISTCPDGVCTGSWSSTTTVVDANPDDCSQFTGEECYESPEYYVSLSSLDPGESAGISIWVRACKDETPTDVCSGWDSDTVTYTLPPLVDAPTGVGTSNAAARSLTVSWDSVKGAARYRVQRQVSGATSWLTRYTNSTSMTISNLDCNTTYRFRVAARGDGTNYSSKYSANSSVVTGSTSQCLDPPPAPTGLSISNATKNSLYASWNSLSGVSQYRLQYREDGTTSWSERYTGNRAITISDLACETTYEFQVAAQGDGVTYARKFGADSSPTTTGTTSDCGTGTHFKFSPSPLALGGTSDVWTVPSGVTSLWVDVDYATGSLKDIAGNINVQRVNSSNRVLSTKVVDSESDSGTFSGVRTGSRVRVTVDDDAFDAQFSVVTIQFLKNGSTGDVIATATIQKESRPNQPVNGTASVSTNDVTLRWEKATKRTGSNPDHYKVVVTDSSGSTVYNRSNISDYASYTYHTVYNLSNDTYSAKVSHCNAVGGCSLPTGISFTINYTRPPIVIPPTNTPTPTPTSTPTPTPSYQLLTPDITVVDPQMNNHVRIQWRNWATPSRCLPLKYDVEFAGSSTDRLYTPNNPDQFDGYRVTVDMDPILNDTTGDTVRVRTFASSTDCGTSDWSSWVKIVDNPLLAPGGNVNGDSRGNVDPNGIQKGKVELKWRAIPGATNIRVRRVDVSGNDSLTTWRPTTYTADTVEVADTSTSHVIDDLGHDSIYGFQLLWEEAGMQVFSARYAYAWTSNRQPNTDERVATYPYYGHWPSKRYEYRICEETFVDDPTTTKNEHRAWMNIIDSAFSAWNTALDNEVVSAEETPKMDCTLGTVTPQTPVPSAVWFLQVAFFFDFDAANVDGSVNEIYLVDGPPAAKFHFAGFIDDIQGACVFFAPGCTISKAYGSGQSASTRLSDPGNGVDILLNKTTMLEGNLETHLQTYQGQVFGHCRIRAGNNDADFQYRTILHEIGHALGSSGSLLLEQLLAVIHERPAYERGHPTLPDAVMNYDYMVSDVIGDEPDCWPHPLDVLAIMALYQTID